MASEIIPAGDSDANVTIFRGELIPICHCIYPIHIMCDNIGLILENIALEIITLGVYTANVTISNVTFDPNVYVHVPLTLYKFIFLSNSGKYGPGNHKGRWVQCWRYDIQGKIDTHMSQHTPHS